MGLLQRLNEEGIEKNQLPSSIKISNQKKSNCIGLLKKSMLLDSKNQLDFFEFTQKFKIKYCAIFKHFTDGYRIINSIGFDGISIINSFSTKDFWDGLLPEKNKIYFFDNKNNSILPFYQFFSFSLKNNFNSIYCVKDSKENILLICSLDEQISYDFEIIKYFNNLTYEYIQHKDELCNIDFSQKFQKVSINLEESIISFLKKNSTSNSEITKKAIVNEIFNSIRLFSESSFLVSLDKNNNIKLLISSSIPIELFTSHLIINLKEKLLEFSQLINIKTEGKLNSYSECFSYLGVN